MTNNTVPNFAENPSKAAVLDLPVERRIQRTSQALAAPAQPSMLARSLSGANVQILDQTALVLALSVALLNEPIRQGRVLSTYLAVRLSTRNLLMGVGLVLVWRVILWLVALYHPHVNRRAVVLLAKIPLALLACTLPILPLFWNRGADDLPHLLVIFWSSACILMWLIRAVVLTYEESIRPMLRPSRTVLICGSGPLARNQALELPLNRDFRYQLLGFVDSEPHSGIETLAPVLCGLADLERLLMNSPVDEVIIGLPLKSRFGEVEQIVEICGRAGVQIQYSLDLFKTDVAKKQSIVMDRTHRVVLEMVHVDQRVIVKDLIDRTLALFGLLLASPVMGLIALSIKLSSHGPIFFVQQRYGLNKRRFGMIKFRSMVVDAEARQAALEHLNETSGPTFKIKHDPRITPVGRLIRSTSLDELPQLFNVLRGDMSLVGPRPLPTRDVERFSEPWLMRRFSVKPGITGLWQVSGRSNTDFDNAIKLDLRYIDKWSPLMDLRILLQTVKVVLRRSGAY